MASGDLLLYGGSFLFAGSRMYFRSTEFGLYLCVMSVLNFFVEDRIAWIVMNRPEKRNALSVELIERMTEV